MKTRFAPFGVLLTQPWTLGTDGMPIDKQIDASQK